MDAITPVLLSQVEGAPDFEKVPKAAPVALSEMSQAPFQIMLEAAVESLQNISKVEFKTNDLIKKYAEKQASVEDVMLAVNELSLAISLASTVVTTAVQSFKEIQQMPI